MDRSLSRPAPVALSADGPLFSPLVAGVMKWGQWGATHTTQGYRQLIDQALDLGITTFDHADIYGLYTTEAEFGAALAGEAALRQRLQLISKCGIQLVGPQRPMVRLKHYNTSKAHILASVEQSLRNLRTDYLDLLLIHRPDPLMAAHEVADAVAQLKASGKVLHFGVSNFSPPQLALLRQVTPIVTNQVEASLLHTAPLFDGTFDQCQQLGIRPLLWSPLGGGDYFDQHSPAVAALRAKVQSLATRYDDPGEDILLLAWLLRHPVGGLPVLGTSRPERLVRAVSALDLALERQDWFDLLEAARGHEVA